MRLRAQRSAIVILVLGIAVLAASTLLLSGEANPGASSQSAADGGTLALYDWLSRLGFQTHRIDETFNLVGTDVLVDIAPTERFSAADVDRTMQHLRSGRDVVIAVDDTTIPAVMPLTDNLGVQFTGRGDDATAHPVTPFDPGDRVHDVPLRHPLSLAGDSRMVPLLSTGDGVTAAAVQIEGGGRAYIVGSTAPFINTGLRTSDSSMLVLALLARARGGAIGFDEVHHLGSTSGGGVGAVFRGPVLLATVGAGIVVLLAVALNGRRMGRPMPRSEIARIPTVSDYVTSMAALFERSRRRGGVADRYASELKQRLSAVTGVDRGLEDDAFVDALARLDRARADALRDVLARARSLAQSDPSDRDLLALARDVDQLERDWSAAAAVPP